MKILAIETSCDETGVAIVEVKDGGDIEVLANELSSQAELHSEYGGVYPTLAKREHAKNLVPLLLGALKEADLLSKAEAPEVSKEQLEEMKKMLEREPELFVNLAMLFAQTKKPTIDRIAVTQGPGLAPALWVGVNFAKALSTAWNIPVVPINHMEGHVVSALFEKQKDSSTEYKMSNFKFPLLALLVSGGHTELVLSNELGKYQLLGHTRDDAAGEAFDKTARMLGIPYPGGPKLSKLAQKAREENLEQTFSLPRPMIDSKDLDFSFSGLKTAVLLLTKKIGDVDETQKKQIAREVEDAIIEVLWAKTQRALEEHEAKTLVVSGGVSANKYLRTYFAEKCKQYTGLSVHFPELALSTDNALMIALVAVTKDTEDVAQNVQRIEANANLKIHS